MPTQPSSDAQRRRRIIRRAAASVGRRSARVVRVALVIGAFGAGASGRRGAAGVDLALEDGAVDADLHVVVDLDPDDCPPRTR